VIEPGQPAPSFSVLADDGRTVTLESLRGRYVVLYFYPKDDTPGCTKEACELRDAFPRFSDADATILGVSADSVASHQKFKTKYSLPFTLLADTNKTLADAFGVWKQKSMYGRTFLGIERTTFLIDPRGIIAHVWHKVKVGGHAAAVASALADAKATADRPVPLAPPVVADAAPKKRSVKKGA
jgi:thioredoxin-dependent peroxiredoxin